MSAVEARAAWLGRYNEQSPFLPLPVTREELALLAEWAEEERRYREENGIQDGCEVLFDLIDLLHTTYPVKPA